MVRTLQQLEPYLQGYWPLKTDFKDHSQNSNDGIPIAIEWKPSSRGLKPSFNGNTSKIVIGNVYNGIKTVSFYVKLTSTTEDLVDLNATATVDINAGTVRGNNFIFPTIYVNGQATALLSDLTGFHHIVITTATGINASAVDIGEIAASFGEIFIEDIQFYSDVLTTEEVLTLYNSTKHAHGIIPAERSYTHQLGIKPESGLVLGFDGHTKNADRTFQDLSGENNHGTNIGTSRDVGYFGEVRSFDGVNDYVDCGSDSSLEDFTKKSVFMWVKLPTFDGTYRGIYDGGYSANPYGDMLFRFNIANHINIYLKNSIGSVVFNIATYVPNTWIYVGYTWNGSIVKYYINGVTSITDNDSFTGILKSTNGNILFGNVTTYSPINGSINEARIYNRALSESEVKSHFNELATLPLFHVDFTDYPDNEDVNYTDNEPIPYSTMRVGSNGTFKIDDDQLVCSENTSTLTLRNNHEFDGNEYITIDIGETKYNGTGTITQGTVTVSIAQGSKFITIAMSDTDVLDSIDIQFRAEVS